VQVIAIIYFFVILTISALTTALCDELSCRQYLKQREYGKAVDACTREINPGIYESPKSYYLRGIAYRGIGEYDKAISDFNKSMELFITNSRQNFNKSVPAQFREKRERDFVTQTNKLLSAPLCDRGRTYLRKKDYEKAVTDFYLSIEYNQQGGCGHAGLAWVYVRNGAYEKAEMEFDKALLLEPDQCSTYYSYACLYSIMNREKESCEWLKKAIEHGYDNWSHISKDIDFDNIRNSTCYKEILKNKKQQI
jgi:tetratricopeptide (TPR) repeat protein